MEESHMVFVIGEWECQFQHGCDLDKAHEMMGTHHISHRRQKNEVPTLLKAVALSLAISGPFVPPEHWCTHTLPWRLITIPFHLLKSVFSFLLLVL